MSPTADSESVSGLTIEGKSDHNHESLLDQLVANSILASANANRSTMQILLRM